MNLYLWDTLSDPRCDDLRSLARDFNLCACWSMPVRDNEGIVIGSFALSSFELCSASPQRLYRLTHNPVLFSHYFSYSALGLRMAR